MDDIHKMFDKYSTKEIPLGDSGIGKFVEIISSGATYSSYDLMANEMKSKYWDRGNCPRKGDNGVIVATAMHKTEEKKLYLIRINDNGTNKEYIMAIEGFKMLN